MSEYHRIEEVIEATLQDLVVQEEVYHAAKRHQAAAPLDVNERVNQLFEEFTQRSPKLKDICITLVISLDSGDSSLDPYYMDGMIAAYQILYQQHIAREREPIVLDEEIVATSIQRLELDFNKTDKQDTFLADCAKLLMDENEFLASFIGVCLSREEYSENRILQSQFMQGAFTMIRILYAHASTRAHTVPIRREYN